MRLIMERRICLVPPIPITGAIADQQSALFSENCHQAGSAKCTNGTGTFMDINIGTEVKPAA